MSASLAQGQGTRQIESLITGGQLNQALVLTEQGLAENSNDVNLMFLKGLILTRQNKMEQAKQVFTRLTDEHPELPEPYNNLAVIYAAEGDYESARNALQKAINTHPSYATAHENLGDIYAKMASRAYNQALELDQGNETAREKLLLVGDLFSTQAGINQAVAATAEREQALTAELQTLENRLAQTEQQTRQELDRVSRTRQELTELQQQRNELIDELERQRSSAVEESNQIASRMRQARADLATLEAQRQEAEQRAMDEKEAATLQARATQQNLDSVKSEIQELQARKNEYINQAETDRAEAEQQIRLARTELADLEARKQELDRAITAQAVTSGSQIDQARQELVRIQAEIAALQQNRDSITNTAADEQEQLLSQVQAARSELQNIRSELSDLQRQKSELLAANETALNSQAAAAQETSQPASVERPPEQALFNALNTWAESWSSKNVDGYLDAYSPVFRPPDGLSRPAWRSQRRERLTAPSYIRVTIENVRVRYIGDEHAQVTFDQSYRSDTYSDKVEKTMLMHFDNGRWLIAEENT